MNLIYLYSGTPGSGKSLHAAKDIYMKIKIRKQNVIANFNINDNVFNNNPVWRTKPRDLGKFLYVDNSQLSVPLLIEYSKRHHKANKEGQTLLIIDECQVHFNPREFQKSDRLEWNNFFSQHRKLGFNIILISQNDRLIDRQIRANLEYNVIHRKINNFKFGQLFPMKVFVAVTYWYGVRERMGMEMFLYNKKWGANFYDSYKMFDNRLTSGNSSAKKILDRIEEEQRSNIIDLFPLVPGSGDEERGGPGSGDNGKEAIL